MKKFLLIITLVFTFFITNINVQAKTLTCNYTTKYEDYFSRFGKDFVVGELDKLYDIYTNEYKDNYPYYSIEVGIMNNGKDYLVFTLYVFINGVKTSWYQDNYDGGLIYHKYFPSPNINSYKVVKSVYLIGKDDTLSETTDNLVLSTPIFLSFSQENSSLSSCIIRPPFYSSIIPSFIMPNLDTVTEVQLETKPNSKEYYTFTKDSTNFHYEPYSNYIGLNINEKHYIEVNLDNYEYIILNLKNYTKKEPFSSNLKVKGMIGITPVYEFGTTEKNGITDRCNISYEDYTDYRLYILENDLINNSVYYIKACEENSFFKFDSSIFDITYVTSDNVNDPVITVGGQEYHTIPFNKLSNSANKNEEENFIPGASEGFTPLEDLTSYITSFWSSLTTFMSLVTKFFNTLPLEIRAVCITFFTTACTLGILKILKN